MVCELNKPVHLNDIGTVFQITITEDDEAKDISSWEDITFKFRLPDKTYLAVPGVVEDAPNGIVSYTTVDGDLDQVGRWHLEVIVELPSWTVTSDSISFWVTDNL